MENLQIISENFEDGGIIPHKYTSYGTGANTKPPYPPHAHPHFKWRNIPQGTKSFALIAEDIDSPHKNPWVNWIVYNIPGNKTDINLQLGDKETQLDGTKQGLNSANSVGYNAPSAEGGKENHRIVFTIYALDSTFDLHTKITKSELLNAINGHILGQAKVTGILSRKFA